MSFVLTCFIVIFPVCEICTLFSPFFPLYFIYILQNLVFFPLRVECKYMYVLHSLFSVKGKFSRTGYFSGGYKIKYCKYFLSVRCWFSKFWVAYCNPLQRPWCFDFGQKADCRKPSLICMYGTFWRISPASNEGRTFQKVAQWKRREL